ncbi:MAG: hypothetical protein ACQERZ_10080 [Fusobacteriota bacterium]
MKKILLLIILTISIFIGCSSTSKERGNLISNNQVSDIERARLNNPEIEDEDKSSIVVSVEGVGAIQNSNQAKARDEAIWDAQRRAVEKAVGTLLASETIVENSQLIENNIYTQSNGFVDSYDIKKEWKDEHLYYIKIRADVKKLDLSKKLILMGLIKKVGDPRIMVVIPEQHIKKPIPDPAVETEIIKNLIKAGYRVVDQSQIKKIRYSEEIESILGGNKEIAKSIANQFEADILITGEAFSILNGETYGMISCGARAEIRGMKISTGEIIFSDAVHSSAIALTEELAAKKALQNAGFLLSNGGINNRGEEIEPIVPKIAKSLLQKSSFQLLLTNISSQKYFEMIEFLKDQRTIKDVFPREFKNNSARIDLDYSRDTNDLYKLLSEKFIFEISSTSQYKMNLNFNN